MVVWSVPGVLHPQEVREDLVGRRVLARHRITRKPLAITYLSPELLADSEFRTRFARDVGRLARVREARVARVHRYCECHHGAAVIGDHVSGTSLRALLLAQGAIGTEAALVVLKDLLRALAACHELGLAHGDVKPEAVILTPAGRVRLVDFGLWTSDSRRLLAQSTPFYLAPEQWSGSPVTPAGDVYAATVTFFECLAGAPPFYADGAAELSAKHEQSTPPVDVVPEPVRELVLRGLAKGPRSRPDVRSLLAQVGEVAAREAGSGWERRGRRELTALLAGRPVLPDVSVPARRSGGAYWRHRKPVRLAAVMGGALALAAGLASPPLAVILPGGGIFGSGGRSPVLAFPELDRDAVPVRVVTNGQLAERALTPAVQSGTVGPLAREHPPAHSILTPTMHTVPYERAAPDALHQGATHPGSVAENQSTVSHSTSGHSTPEESTPVPPACALGLTSAPKTCAAATPEQPTPDSAGSSADPSRVSIPVQLPAPVKVPVALPERVELPVQVLKSIPIWEKTQPDQDTHTPKGTQTQADSPGRAKKAPAGWQDTTTKTGEPTNWAQRSSASSGSSGSFGSSGYHSEGTRQSFGHSGKTGP
jgi:serine/threonine-protein kinase